MDYHIHELTERLLEKSDEITNWMKKKRSEVPMPIYGSVDIRDSGWKVAVVDANQFPAGFNNISKDDELKLSSLLHDHIQRENLDCKWVHVYPESHTRNQGYIENISTIKRLLEMAGYRCTVGSPELEGHGSLDGISEPLILDQVILSKDSLLVNNEVPDMILLNNDLTEGILPGLLTNRVTPPPNMGWQRRRKSEHYACLQNYVEEIAVILEIYPWHLMTDWFVSENKCLEKESCRLKLATEVDVFLEKIAQKYNSLGINRKPVAFVKNDRGTYGLGIMAISSGDELLNLSNRNKMEYIKNY